MPEETARDERPPTPGAVEATAIAVAGLAFSLSSLLLRRATPLPPELLDALAALLATWGLSPLLHRKAGPFAATLLRGAGLVVALLLPARGLVPPFDAALLPLSLVVLGATLLQARARSGRGGLPTDLLGGLLLASGALLAAWLADRFPEPVRLRVALSLAAAFALAGLLLRAWARRSGHAPLAPTPVGTLLGAALAAAYLAYRGLVAGRLEHLALYEWILGVGVAALLLARLRRQARAEEVPESWESDARRHADDVAPVHDPRALPLAAAFARYLEQGAGFDDYRAALRRLGGGATFRKALEDLRPVPPARGRAQRAAREQRLEAHRTLLQSFRP